MHTKTSASAMQFGNGNYISQRQEALFFGHRNYKNGFSFGRKTSIQVGKFAMPPVENKSANLQTDVMHSKFLWTSCLVVQGVQHIMQFPYLFFFVYHQTENIHAQVQTAFIKKKCVNYFQRWWAFIFYNANLMRIKLFS